MNKPSHRLIAILALCVVGALLAACRGTAESPTTAAILPSEPADNSAVVYVTEYGTKYHREGCQYLSQSCIETTENKAIEDGYEACSVCKP